MVICEVKLKGNKKEGYEKGENKDKNLVKGNQLIKEIIEYRNGIYLTNEKDPQKKFNFSNEKGSMRYGNKLRTDIRIDRNQLVYVDEWDWRMDKMVEKALMSLEMTTGHELIHFWRDITNRHNLGTAIHWTINKDNEIISDFAKKDETKGSVEEYRTVGIGNSTKDRAKNIGVHGDYNSPGDITENDLRKEQGLPYRMRYAGDEKWK